MSGRSIEELKKGLEEIEARWEGLSPNECIERLVLVLGELHEALEGCQNEEAREFICGLILVANVRGLNQALVEWTERVELPSMEGCKGCESRECSAHQKGVTQ